jgi:hypothetical protein
MDAPHRCLLALLLLAVAGCSRGTTPQAKPASQEVVEGFYEALLRQDWQQAYGHLDHDCQRRWTPRQFVELARSHLRSLGFVPEQIHVQSCQENGDSAIAHISFTGHVPSKRWRHKDGTVLRQVAGSWRVVLPSNFGQIRR